MPASIRNLVGYSRKRRPYGASVELTRMPTKPGPYTGLAGTV